MSNQNQINIIEYNNRTEKSYLSKKLDLPEYLDYQEKHFLGLVEGDIERTVTKIVRLKALDYDTKEKKQKGTRKEFILYYENWYGKDWQGRKVAPVTDHIEGAYMEQETEPKVYQNKKIGDTRIGQHEVHYIPFSKKAIDEIIQSHDQEEDKESILYCVKTSNMRNASYTYEQFVNSSFEECVSMMMTNGGPQMYEWNKRQGQQQQNTNKSVAEK